MYIVCGFYGKTMNTLQLAEHLKNATSREEGQAILSSQNNTVKQLRLLAKHLGLSVSKRNKMELVDKLIESTIGCRIDSAIIQNHKWDKT